MDDGCEQTYICCQGKVVQLVRQTDTKAVKKIKWDHACLQPGVPSMTKHVLKKIKELSSSKRHMEDKWHAERKFIAYDKLDNVMMNICV